MTISSQVNRVTMVGNGTTTAYPVSFPFHAQADLIVLSTVIATGVQTTKTITTHYTISGTTDALGHYPNGGTVNFLVAPASTERITIYRDPVRTQSLDLVENDDLPAESVEAQFDYVTMLLQRVSDLLIRSLRQPDGDNANIGTLPSAVDRALKFQAYDAAGDPIAAAGTSANLGPVSAFINTLLDDADAATARATLGVDAELPDNTHRVVGSSDATKKVADEVDGLTTATTRTRFHADEDASIAATWEITNLTLVATVAANALTIAVKTKSGADPSAANPIIVKFKKATDTDGTYDTVPLTGAISLVISSGSTLDTVNATAHRLYIGLANDGGTLRLFAYNPLISASLSLKGLQDDLLYSSTAEGGAGGADSAQVLYSGTAFTAKAVRLIGYLESTQATAGTWATAPSKLHLLKPWDKRTHDIVAAPIVQDGATATGTTTIPIDNTIPQNTEGTEFMTLAVTAISTINLHDIEHIGQYDNGAATPHMTAALFKDSIADALAAQLSGRASTGPAEIVLRHRRRAESVTYKIRAGTSSAGTTRINGNAGAAIYGGTQISSLRVTEIMV